MINDDHNEIMYVTNHQFNSNCFSSLPSIQNRSHLSLKMVTSSTLVETVSINYEDFTEGFLTCGTCLCTYDAGQYPSLIDHSPHYPLETIRETMPLLSLSRLSLWISKGNDHLVLHCSIRSFLLMNSLHWSGSNPIFSLIHPLIQLNN